ncbi:Predicted arabinose efflux permease, MFS family [Thermoactinomyces sp. DSM 45891]|uniref:MFS transporter n=1 Tax=Thermoactinomyces sp. DSM 45891 TaxID=1761907 RepID=UPI00090F692D|nr:MFS transporter [Thermoactinomyces sp. DSM 45891]SFX57199.1 Predicted arabinose efflux permease, MFS family [Thermoactinomyces sp. DSM 45891]
MVIKQFMKLKAIHRLILLLDFIFGLSRGIIIPFLVTDMMTRLGASYTTIAGSVFIYFIARTFGGVIGGALSDRYGRRPLILMGLFVTSASYLFLPFVSDVLEFTTVYIVLGFAHSFFRSVFSALIGDTVDKKDPTIPFAMFYINQNISVGIGALLGGVILAVGSSFIYISTGLLLLCFSIITMFHPLLKNQSRSEIKVEEQEPVEVEQSYQGKSSHIYILISIFLLNVILVSTYGVFNDLLGAILHDFVELSPFVIGLLFALNSFLIVILQLQALKIVSRWSFMSQMLFTATLFSLFHLLLGTLERIPAIYLCVLLIVVFTIGELTHVANLKSKVNQFTPAKKRGLAFGILNATFNIGFGLGPFVFGFFLDKLGLERVGYSFFVFYLATAVVLSVLVVKEKQSKRSPKKVQGEVNH